MTTPEKAAARSKTALAISAAIPIVVAGGGAVGILLHEDVMPAAIALATIGLMVCASPFVAEFEAAHGRTRSNVVGAARPYVYFHATRAGVSTSLALGVIWGLWALPALGWVALIVAGAMGAL